MNKYRTQYYDFGDLAIPNELMKCEEVLNDFGKWNSYKSIDQIIELYNVKRYICLLYTSPSPRDPKTSRMPSSA